MDVMNSAGLSDILGLGEFPKFPRSKELANVK